MSVLSLISSGKKNGSGHIGRSLPLINYMKKKWKNKKFIIISNSSDFKAQVEREKIDFKKVNFSRTKSLINQIHNLNPSFIILDSYELNNIFLKQLYRKYKNILVIDDHLKRKQFCKYYLNYNFFSSSNLKKIKKKITAKKYLLGHKYFLGNFKKKNITQSNNVLIFFGSNDNHKIMFKILKILKSSKFSKFKFYIIIGKYFFINKKKFKKNENFIFKETLNKTNYFNLLKKMQFAIGAGGVSMIERILFKITNLIFVTADNQKFGVKLAKQKKLISYAGNSSSIKLNKINEHLENFLIKKKYNKLKNNLEKLDNFDGFLNVFKEIKYEK